MVFTIYFSLIINSWDTFQDSFQMELPQKKKKGFYQAEKTEGLYCFLEFLNSIRTPKYTYSKDKHLIHKKYTCNYLCALMRNIWQTSLRCCFMFQQWWLIQKLVNFFRFLLELIYGKENKQTEMIFGLHPKLNELLSSRGRPYAMLFILVQLS